jgi:hypothetical protein
MPKINISSHTSNTLHRKIKAPSFSYIECSFKVKSYGKMKKKRLWRNKWEVVIKYEKNDADLKSSTRQPLPNFNHSVSSISIHH